MSQDPLAHPLPQGHALSPERSAAAHDNSSGRVALVTGGSRGIGLACARLLQLGGDRVAVTYHESAPPGSAETPPGCSELVAIKCDVRDAAQVDAAFSYLEEHLGPVEVLVASAGITRDMLLVRMDESSWSEVLDTNLTAVYRVVKRAARSMIRSHSGRVVIVSSVVAFMGSPGQSNYAASKAALTGFARSVARELATRGITVNLVAPGVVETDMTASLSRKRLEELVSLVPMGRMASPEEVASAVAWLASPEASYVTGTVLAVDGGLGMGF